MTKFLIISRKNWDNSNLNLFKKNKNFIFSNKFNLKYVNQIKPKIIFFVFWSKKIPEKIFNNNLCIQFHSSDLPKFRGGSPIQNQILNKVYKTKLTAFRINKKIDAGDICMKSNILLHGRAEDILKNIEKKAFQMILKISRKKRILFKKQKGKSSFYFRRNEHQSDIKYTINKELNSIYDFIRMLDAQNYPKAFHIIGNKKIEFFNVLLKNKSLSGKFLITINK